MKPNPCHVLAVDPGKTSGAASFVRGELRWADTVDVADPDHVYRVVRSALEAAFADDATLVLVGETWGRGGYRGMAQWQGLGAAWKQWDWALDRVKRDLRNEGHKGPAPKKMRMHAATWRSRVFGGRVGKKIAKELAIEVTYRKFGVSLAPDEHDAAEACMIGYCATFAPEVRKLLPKRAFKIGEGKT